jgi:hypothetical protein
MFVGATGNIWGIASSRPLIRKKASPTPEEINRQKGVHARLDGLCPGMTKK